MAFFIQPIGGECCDDPCSKKENACDECCPCNLEDYLNPNNSFYWVTYEQQEVESNETSTGCTKSFAVAQSYDVMDVSGCDIGDISFSKEYDAWRNGSAFLPSSGGCRSPFGDYYDSDNKLVGSLVRNLDSITYVKEGGLIADYNCDNCTTTITRDCTRYELTEDECADGLPLCDDVDKPCDACDQPCCTGSEPICGQGSQGSGTQGSGTQGSGPQGSGPCCEETNDCCPQTPCCPPNSDPCGGAPCCGSGVSNPPTCGSGVQGSGTQGSGPCCDETNDCDPDPCCDEDPNCECEPCYDGGPCEKTLCEETEETECTDNTFTEPTSPIEP